MKIAFLSGAFCFFTLNIWAQWTELGVGFSGNPADNIGQFRSVSMNDEGTLMAYGAAFGDGATTNSGYVKVYKWNESDWSQYGQTIYGNETLEGTGASTSLNSSGVTLAIGSTLAINDNGWQSGAVRVFDFIDGQWVQRGATLYGDGSEDENFQNDLFGISVSLSEDGNFLAVGASFNSSVPENLENQGLVKVFQWNGLEWSVMGEPILGTQSNENFGNQVALNASGSTLVTGGKNYNAINGLEDTGVVEVYFWNGSSWQLMGNPIIGQLENDRIGASVDIDADGTTVAFGGFQGAVGVFDWNGNFWMQRGFLFQGSEDIMHSVVKLSDDGNVVVIGEPWFSTFTGQVRFHYWNGNNWIQFGAPILPSEDVEIFGTSLAVSSNCTEIAIGTPNVDIEGNQAGQIRVFKNEAINSVDQFENSNLTIYPNPAWDRLNLNTSNNELWQVYDGIGNMLLRGTGNTISGLSQLPNGIYFLDCNGKIEKFIIQKLD
ncbi:MAG: T9SS type A sorting domain-containing protein [Flavobacteriales bacterium]